MPFIGLSTATSSILCSRDWRPEGHGRLVHLPHGPSVARVGSSSVRAVGQRAPQNYPSSATKDTGYYAALEYTFTVLEYLKGSGGSQVTAYAVGSDVEGFNDDSAIYATTQAKAAKLAEDLLEVRDLRWENREAILFLRHVPAHDYYWLGLLDLESIPNFTVRQGMAPRREYSGHDDGHDDKGCGSLRRR